MFAHFRTAAIGATAALALAAAGATPAAALGDKEREILLGLTAAVIVGALINQAQSQDRPRQPQGQVFAPEPQYFASPERPVVRVPEVQPSIYRTPAAQAFNGYGAEERRAIQQRLKAYGYYKRGIDGTFGPGTYNAVLAFAADNGLSQNLRATADARGIYDALIY
jgi:hypothetical protein